MKFPSTYWTVYPYYNGTFETGEARLHISFYDACISLNDITNTLKSEAIVIHTADGITEDVTDRCRKYLEVVESELNAEFDGSPHWEEPRRAKVQG